MTDPAYQTGCFMINLLARSIVARRLFHGLLPQIMINFGLSMASSLGERVDYQVLDGEDGCMTYRDYPPAAIVHPEGGYRGSQSRIPEDVQATVLQLHEEGRSVRDIARRAGIAVGTVSRLVHAAGLSFDQDATHRATLARSRAAAG